jgi:hypothetical protein
MLILASNLWHTFSTILDKSDEIPLYPAIRVEKAEKSKTLKISMGVEKGSHCHHNIYGKYCKTLMKKRRGCFRDKQENSR